MSIAMPDGLLVQDGHGLLISSEFEFITTDVHRHIYLPPQYSPPNSEEYVVHKLDPNARYIVVRVSETKVDLRD